MSTNKVKQSKLAFDKAPKNIQDLAIKIIKAERGKVFKKRRIGIYESITDEDKANNVK